jgi:hypothetical protein
MNRALWLFVLTLLGLHLWKDENVQLLPPRGAINYRVVDKMKRVCNDLLKERYVNRYDISNMQVFDQTVGFPGEGPDEGHSKRKSPGKSSSDDPQHEGGLKKNKLDQDVLYCVKMLKQTDTLRSAPYTTVCTTRSHRAARNVLVLLFTPHTKFKDLELTTLH